MSVLLWQDIEICSNAEAIKFFIICFEINGLLIYCTQFSAKNYFMTNCDLRAYWFMHQH